MCRNNQTLFTFFVRENENLALFKNYIDFLSFQNYHIITLE
nr:MAG TPA: hypothetical protein [Caudoviricetes sp.]